MTPPSGPSTPAATTRPSRRRLSSRTDTVAATAAAAATAPIPPAQKPTRSARGDAATGAAHGVTRVAATAPSTPAPDAEAQPALSLFEQWRRATRTITDLYGSVYEGRRTYHGYMPGSYSLPNDDEEQIRLYMQHASWWLILSGVLGYAPILRRRQSPAFVLDVATGTGSWANHFGQRYPESKVVGTDLSLIQPSGFPNVSFVVEDSEEQDWTHQTPVDYVHFRNTLSSFNDTRTVIRKAYDQLRPGGWIEFQEATWEMHCPDGTLAGTAIERWSGAVLEGLRRSGRDTVGNLRALAANIAAAGFVDVEDRAFFVPCNAWAAHDARLRQLGLLNASIIPHAVESYRKILGFSGLDPDDVDALIDAAKRDVADTGIHYSLRAHCIYGRKPNPDEEK